MRARRAVVVVLDAVGAGALPDAADYGDAGTNTLGHLAELTGGLELPNLQRLGLGSILPLTGVAPAAAPVLHGRLHPLGPGKDSTTGHWELMGVVARSPRPTYPDGFPPEVIETIERASGRKVVCNAPNDGLSAIEEHGEEALRDGALIVYTSQDSVLQIAAHVNALSVQDLHRLCARVRKLMIGEHAVGRVIARPFAGVPGAFERTRDRHDFALPPQSRSHLDELREAGVATHAVGKVGQLFGGRGFDHAHAGATNAEAIDATGALLRELDAGFVFTNLIETDQVYGHRKDADGFHHALREIDTAVAGWEALLGPGDLLVLTADHGCDPAHPGTDHTREHAPLLALFDGHGGRRHDGPLADVGASVLRWLAARDAPALPGTPFV
ncbi:phosphopentomutase [Conexibacter woesei]|uniref:Phosphopentomutase n=1 Tax=Conexibacter woesei (strain DSM 14684 / CCUG 47730 / CIP 108061 / JCM 11494 / NBRC 100937 / ID131577) TaxID=469383 RepID=D3FCZ8_CONWI|nr:phosphopentomutase [Conexibacter woesei]ADB51510.1 phosphopentomutase [Conexibacter woesei DSM 14684]